MTRSAKPRRRKPKAHQGKQRSLKGNGRSKRHAPSAVSVLELLNFDGGKQALTDSEDEGLSDATSFEDDKDGQREESIDNNILAFLKEQLKAKEAAVTTKMEALAKRAMASTKSYATNIELDKNQTIQGALDEIGKIHESVQATAERVRTSHAQLKQDDKQDLVELSALTKAYETQEDQLARAREANMVRLQSLRDQYVHVVERQSEVLRSLAA